MSEDLKDVLSKKHYVQMRGGLKGAKTPPSTKPKTSKIFGLIVLGKFESTGTLLDVE